MSILNSISRTLKIFLVKEHHVNRKYFLSTLILTILILSLPSHAESIILFHWNKPEYVEYKLQLAGSGSNIEALINDARIRYFNTFGSKGFNFGPGLYTSTDLLTQFIARHGSDFLIIEIEYYGTNPLSKAVPASLKPFDLAKSIPKYRAELNNMIPFIGFVPVNNTYIIYKAPEASDNIINISVRRPNNADISRIWTTIKSKSDFDTIDYLFKIAEIKNSLIPMGESKTAKHVFDELLFNHGYAFLIEILNINHELMSIKEVLSKLEVIASAYKSHEEIENNKYSELSSRIKRIKQTNFQKCLLSVIQSI